MFKPENLRERQCIAKKKNGTQCNANVSNDALSRATRLIRDLRTTLDGSHELLETIVNSMACKQHGGAALEPQLQDLIHVYTPEFQNYAQTHEHLETLESRPCNRNSQNSLKQKVHRVIELKQFPQGVVYTYTWNKLPGHVKIGCAKVSSNARTKQWTKCYPDLLLTSSTGFDFPQRMEELFHLQLAAKRREIGCKVESCKSRYHDEWFECSIEEVQTVMKGWKVLTKRRPLYGIDTRQLTDFWKERLAWVEAENPGVSDGDFVRALFDSVQYLDVTENMRLMSLVS